MFRQNNNKCFFFSQSMKKLETEATILAQMTSPHIVRYNNCFTVLNNEKLK